MYHIHTGKCISIHSYQNVEETFKNLHSFWLYNLRMMMVTESGIKFKSNTGMHSQIKTSQVSLFFFEYLHELINRCSRYICNYCTVTFKVWTLKQAKL